MKKVEIKKKLALVNFQFEFGNRIINNFRSLLLVIVIIKLFTVSNYLYPIIIVVYALCCWSIGYFADMLKLPEYFQTVYYDKSGKMNTEIKSLLSKGKDYENRCSLVAVYPINITSGINNNRWFYKTD